MTNINKLLKEFEESLPNKEKRNKLVPVIKQAKSIMTKQQVDKALNLINKYSEFVKKDRNETNRALNKGVPASKENIIQKKILFKDLKKQFKEKLRIDRRTTTCKCIFVGV